MGIEAAQLDVSADEIEIPEAEGDRAVREATVLPFEKRREEQLVAQPIGQVATIEYRHQGLVATGMNPQFTTVRYFT